MINPKACFSFTHTVKEEYTNLVFELLQYPFYNYRL